MKSFCKQTWRWKKKLNFFLKKLSFCFRELHDKLLHMTSDHLQGCGHLAHLLLCEWALRNILVIIFEM